jgi:hypothetical protein
MAKATKKIELSMRHLPIDARYELNSFEGMVADELPDGWLVWVPTDVDDHFADYEEDAPTEVIDVLRHARTLGCDHILFDTDGPIDPTLPIYENED